MVQFAVTEAEVPKLAVAVPAEAAEAPAITLKTKPEAIAVERMKDLNMMVDSCVLRLRYVTSKRLDRGRLLNIENALFRNLDDLC